MKCILVHSSIDKVDYEVYPSAQLQSLDVKINYLEVSELDQLDPCHCPPPPSPHTLRTFLSSPHLYTPKEFILYKLN